jgi:hypothetical protein
MGVLYRHRYLYTFLFPFSLKVVEGCYRAVLENSLTKAVKKQKKEERKRSYYSRTPAGRCREGEEKKGVEKKRTAR